MNISDPVADMLTRIRNAGRAGHSTVLIPASKLKQSIADVLTKQGYIAEVELETEGAKRTLKLTLKYADSKPVIEGLRRISKPSRRIYVGAGEVPRVRGGLGTAIVSTPQGVVTDKEARSLNVGGELLCYVW